MVLTARYRVHAVSVDPEGRYHVAMEPVYEGAEENTEAFAGKPAGLIRIGPLPAEAGKHFTEGVEVLADFEPLEEDIEDAEDPAPATPSPIAQADTQPPVINPTTWVAPAEPPAAIPAPESPAANTEPPQNPPASTDQGYPGYGSSY